MINKGTLAAHLRGHLGDVLGGITGRRTLDLCSPASIMRQPSHHRLSSDHEDGGGGCGGPRLRAIERVRSTTD